MKLKVFYKRHAWIDAETIDELKDLITGEFSLKAEGDDLSEHLLVRDNRDLKSLNMNPITGCVDLLQLADGSILDDDLCKDGDTLVLGWKGPFKVRLVTDFNLEEGHIIQVDNSFTLCNLKSEIEKLTREPVTENNLPEVLFNGDGDKPLLFFGYYKIRKYNLRAVEIHRSKDNTPVSKYPIMSWVKLDANGNECLIHICGENYEIDTEAENENIENEKRKLKSMENIEKKKKKMMKKKKKNKDIFSKESQPFYKERANIKKKKKKKTRVGSDDKGSPSKCMEVLESS